MNQQKHPNPGPSAARLARSLAIFILTAAAGLQPLAQAHIVPPENLHPLAESYRRLGFLLHLNPVPWDDVRADTERIATEMKHVDAEQSDRFLAETSSLLEGLDGTEPTEPAVRKTTARGVQAAATRMIAEALRHHVGAAGESLGDYAAASRHLEEARQIWAAIEPAVRANDPEAFRRLGECWLELSSALGHPGIRGIGAIPADPEAFASDTEELEEYLAAGFTDQVRFASVGPLTVLPAGSPTYVAASVASLPAKLPPGSETNKQLPRPRQILNMAERGVDESETTLIALGDMAFDSALIFGEPARSLAITCNTCHNKSITNPNFFIPGLSARPGGMDVSNSFFAPHANNGHFDPIDIPDLRGIRFTAPYGRNGRFDSLREFTRNVIVNEFNGAEPDPLLLDGMIAYMLEFDFLANPQLEADGSLAAKAPEAARRGEALFNRPFESMGGSSCASCHQPSDHFLDRKRHDIGSADPAGDVAGARDGAFDTPTLLSAKYTAPYFHDGSLPTLASVVDWFDGRFALGLSDSERADLTAYLETVGDGEEAYEDTVFTLEAEMEEFSFFLSAYEFLRQRRQTELIDTTFATIAFEIRAHKWDIQDPSFMPVLDRLAGLMDEALAARGSGDLALADAKVDEYRTLYQDNAEHLR